MRITFALDAPLPSSGAQYSQKFYTASALACRGHQVTIMAPRYPGDDQITACDLKAYYETKGELEFVQVPVGGLPIEGARKAILAGRQICQLAAKSADVIYTRKFEMLALAAGLKKNVVFDHYRPWGDHFPFARPAIRWLMKRKYFLGAILHSRFAHLSFEKMGIPAERLMVAHNGYDPTHMRPTLTREEARAKLSLPDDRSIAVYAGRLNHKKGLDLLLDMAVLTPDVLFLLVGSEGDGPVERAAESVENVRVVSWKPMSEVAPWLYAADVLVIPPSSAPLNKHRNCVLPIKTFHYLAAGRPILAPNSPDTSELLKDGETACCIEPDDAKDAAQALIDLIAAPDVAARLAANARKLAGQLTWNHRGEKIERFLEARLAARRQDAL